FIVSVHPIFLNNLLRKRQGLVNSRHTIAQNDFCLLAHRTQDLTAPQRRTDSVAVRPGVRSQHKPMALFDLPENFFEHATNQSSVFGRHSNLPKGQLSVIRRRLSAAILAFLTTEDRRLTHYFLFFLVRPSSSSIL